MIEYLQQINGWLRKELFTKKFNAFDMMTIVFATLMIVDGYFFTGFAACLIGPAISIWLEPESEKVK